jgi:hypothetical protein
MKFLSLIVIFLHVSACTTTNETKPQNIKSYTLESYSTFPTTSMKFKHKKSPKKKISTHPEQLSDVFSDHNFHYEVNTLEYTEQIKYWSFGSIIIGLAGISSDTKSKSAFGALAALGVIGASVIPSFQGDQMISIQEKLNSKTTKKNPPENHSEEIELNNSDFE